MGVWGYRDRELGGMGMGMGMDNRDARGRWEGSEKGKYVYVLNYDEKNEGGEGRKDEEIKEGRHKKRKSLGERKRKNSWGERKERRKGGREERELEFSRFNWLAGWITVI